MTLGMLGFGALAFCAGYQILESVDAHQPVTTTQFVLFFGSSILAFLFGLAANLLGDDD